MNQQYLDPDVILWCEVTRNGIPLVVSMMGRRGGVRRLPRPAGPASDHRRLVISVAAVFENPHEGHGRLFPVPRARRQMSRARPEQPLRRC